MPATAHKIIPTTLVMSWQHHFGDDPQLPRAVLERAFTAAPDLLEALNKTVPDFQDYPNPKVLLRYLTAVESVPLTLEDGRRVRARRAGQRWSWAAYAPLKISA